MESQLVYSHPTTVVYLHLYKLQNKTINPTLLVQLHSLPGNFLYNNDQIRHKNQEGFLTRRKNWLMSMFDANVFVRYFDYGYILNAFYNNAVALLLLLGYF